MESNVGPSLQRGDLSRLNFQGEQKHRPELKSVPQVKASEEPNPLKISQRESSLKNRRNLPSRRNTSKTRMNNIFPPADEASENPRQTSMSSNLGAKMSDVIQRRCKNVISKLQRRIAKEGQQIVPLLSDLWKRMETSAGSQNMLDLRKIDVRVERLEYSGVMELVSDVQIMLKNAMQYYGFSHEVRTEARKFHDLFFDIMKFAFPDSDFRVVRTALSFSTTASTSVSVSSPRQPAGSLSKKKKTIINEVEPDPTPPQKPLRGTGEAARIRVNVPLKELSRLGSGSGGSSQPDDSPRLTHPGELVICKKKRKDREKSAVKQRPGSSGPVSPGPASPPSMGRTTRGSILRGDERAPTQQPGWTNQPSSIGGRGSMGWANPVKRSRTDSGKRRPSHP
jgi:SWI/SNF-related matrix-associated actin-dependent regulator of chromatin subfamily A protein 2/4